MHQYSTSWPSEASHWMLDRDFLFLNHGSFGACPVPVLEKQAVLRNKMESQPVRFMLRELDGIILESKNILAAFVGCNPDDLVFVPNVTHGVNTIFRSLKFNPGDEILITNHIYPACRNVVNFISETTGAVILEVKIGFPPQKDEDFLDPLLNAVSPKTKVLLLDHISSQTALVFPVEKIVREMKKLGIETVVDGAHAPGSIPLNIREIDPGWYVGNCHKWLCAPKGAGFLYTRENLQDIMQPLSMSHVAGKDKKFWERFHWTGTDDPTAACCVAESIAFMKSLFPGGWKELMERNHRLALKGRDILSEILPVGVSCPDRYMSSMAILPLPPSDKLNPLGIYFVDELQDRLFKDYQAEVMISSWPQVPSRLLRISAQVYNSEEQYHLLAEILKKELR